MTLDEFFSDHDNESPFPDYENQMDRMLFEENLVGPGQAYRVDLVGHSQHNESWRWIQQRLSCPDLGGRLTQYLLEPS